MRDGLGSKARKFVFWSSSSPNIDADIPDKSLLFIDVTVDSCPTRHKDKICLEYRHDPCSRSTFVLERVTPAHTTRSPRRRCLHCYSLKAEAAPRTFPSFVSSAAHRPALPHRYPHPGSRPPLRCSRQLATTLRRVCVRDTCAACSRTWHASHAIQADTRKDSFIANWFLTPEEFDDVRRHQIRQTYHRESSSRSASPASAVERIRRAPSRCCVPWASVSVDPAAAAM